MVLLRRNRGLPCVVCVGSSVPKRPQGNRALQDTTAVDVFHL